jgi:hypothetical protein
MAKRAFGAVQHGGAAFARGAASLGKDTGEGLVRAVGELYDKALDVVLTSDQRIGSATEAKASLREGGDSRAVAEQIQQVAVIAAPVVRRLRKAGRLPGAKRVPWVFTATTVAAIAAQLRVGVREVQVIGAFLASRIEAVTGRQADRDLVKRATVELYLSPRKEPSVERRRPRTVGLMFRWLVRGVFGRDSATQAVRAVEAVETLDVDELVREWSMRHRALDVAATEVGATEILP